MWRRKHNGWERSRTHMHISHMEVNCVVGGTNQIFCARENLKRGTVCIAHNQLCVRVENAELREGIATGWNEKPSTSGRERGRRGVKKRSNANCTNREQRTNRCSSGSSSCFWLRAHLKDILLPTEAEVSLLPRSYPASSYLSFSLKSISKTKIQFEISSFLLLSEAMKTTLGGCETMHLFHGFRKYTENNVSRNGQTATTDNNCTKTSSSKWILSSSFFSFRLFRPRFSFSHIKSLTTALKTLRNDCYAHRLRSSTTPWTGGRAFFSCLANPRWIEQWRFITASETNVSITKFLLFTDFFSFVHTSQTAQAEWKYSTGSTQCKQNEKSRLNLLFFDKIFDF